MSLPNFDTMTRDQIIDWVMNNPITELLPTMTPGDDPIIVLNPPTTEPMTLISVRMPEAVIATLDEVVGRDKDGRSGLIRLAVTEYLQRHHGQAAA